MIKIGRILQKKRNRPIYISDIHIFIYYMCYIIGLYYSLYLYYMFYITCFILLILYYMLYIYLDN